MANLLGANIGANYKGFLNLGTTINTPLDATVRSITDGMGNVSPLQLSSSVVGISTNLGIGTTTPSGKLHVDGSMYLQNSATGVESITFSNGPQIEANGPAGYFKSGQVYTNTTTSNVGIGTSTPSYKLNLYGSTALYNIGTNNAFAANTNYFVGHGLNASTPANITSKIGFISDASFMNSFSDAIAFYTTPTTFSPVNSDASTERMRITNSGNVGIGTSSPFRKLDIMGDLKVGLEDGSVERIWTSGGPTVQYDPIASVYAFGGGYIEIDTFNGVVIMQYSPIVIGGNVPHASAKLDVQSTTQGILFPRMTTTQKNAISSPAAGLVIYDTTLNKLCVRTPSGWQTITSA